jgi:hypothetical protein
MCQQQQRQQQDGLQQWFLLSLALPVPCGVETSQHSSQHSTHSSASLAPTAPVCLLLQLLQELLHQRTAWDQVMCATSSAHIQPEDLAHMMQELLRFDVLATPPGPSSTAQPSGTHLSGSHPPVGGDHQGTVTNVTPESSPPATGQEGNSTWSPTQGRTAAQTLTNSDNNTCDGRQQAPLPAGGVQSVTTIGSSSTTGATQQQQAALQTMDVQAVVRRAFALLATRCMHAEPIKRPSFADIAARLGVMQRALAAQHSSQS